MPAANDNQIKVKTMCESWGRFPLYSAKIGTGPSNCIIVKRARRFFVGQRIEYSTLNDLQGRSTGCTPTWTSGVIWKIEGDRLYVGMD